MTNISSACLEHNQSKCWQVFPSVNYIWKLRICTSSSGPTKIYRNLSFTILAVGRNTGMVCQQVYISSYLKDNRYIFFIRTSKFWLMTGSSKIFTNFQPHFFLICSKLYWDIKWYEFILAWLKFVFCWESRVLLHEPARAMLKNQRNLGWLLTHALYEFMFLILFFHAAGGIVLKFWAKLSLTFF